MPVAGLQVLDVMHGPSVLQLTKAQVSARMVAEEKFDSQEQCACWLRPEPSATCMTATHNLLLCRQQAAVLC